MEGVTTLTQIQAICQPQKILALVRDAIKSGKLENTGTAQSFTASKEIEIGRIANDGQSLNDQQLQALYWYFLGTSKTLAANTGANLSVIKAILLSIKNPPIDSDGKAVLSYPTAAVIAALKSTSSELRSQIEGNIDTAASETRGPQPASADSGLPSSSSVIPSLSETSAGRRIDVQIK